MNLKIYAGYKLNLSVQTFSGLEVMIKGNMLKSSGQYLWYPKGQKSDMFLDDENMIFYFLNEYDILFIRYS